ncbi:MAG: hypothetical protein ABUS57_05435, partial [Pseudomonadota bacterium]
KAYLNVDAMGRDPIDKLALADDQRAELLQHRCFVRSLVSDQSNLWPWDESAIVPHTLLIE